LGEHARTRSRRHQVSQDRQRADAGPFRWIRSYIVKEQDGRLGSFCIYQAQDPESIREHARRVGMPGDQIFPVVTTVIVREDPAEESAAA
jgi:hypothetical protein